MLLSDLDKEQIQTPGLGHSSFHPQIQTEKASPIYATQKSLPNTQEAPKKGLYFYLDLPTKVWMSVYRFPFLLVIHSQASNLVSHIFTEMCQRVSILMW